MSRIDKTIIETCFPLFKLIYDFNIESHVSDFQLLQSKIIQEFFNVEEELKFLGMSVSVCMDVKFVMSAFLDEMIMKRGGDCASAWSKDSLQIQFFKENLGGEKFFERLSYLQRFSDKRFDILEVYYWCLELGYEGKYRKNESSDLKAIRENLRIVIQPNQVASHLALNLKDVSAPKDTDILFANLKKASLTTIFLGVLLGGVAVYGVQTLVVEYLLSKLEPLSTYLV